MTVCDSHYCEGLEYQVKEIRYSNTSTICLGLGQSHTELQFDINKTLEHYTVSFNDSLKEVKKRTWVQGANLFPCQEDQCMGPIYDSIVSWWAVKVYAEHGFSDFLLFTVLPLY